MLTKEHAIVDYEGGRARPDRLTHPAHAPYVDYAKRMLAVYRTGVGRTRRDLHRSVEGIFAQEPDCHSRRIQAFCKLLDDESVFETDRHGKAAALRLRVFSQAADYFPLVRKPDRLFETSEDEAKARIAREIGRPWTEIEPELYADVMAFQRLKAFDGYPDAAALLSRYNVAQLQACLYSAEHLTVTVTSGLRTILRAANLAQLLHEIRRLGPSRYRIRFTGPTSVLRQTRRYGVALARFVPALLACDGWSMEASLVTPWGRNVRLELSSRDGLRSDRPAHDAFDSAVEESFAAKFGSERDGWRLERESEILHEGQTAFLPDFVFRHEDGTQVLFEIVGFWTPEYLAAKRDTLRRFGRHRILLAVPARSLRDRATIPDDVIVYKTALKLEPVMEALERVRQPPRSEERG